MTHLLCGTHIVILPTILNSCLIPEPVLSLCPEIPPLYFLPDVNSEILYKTHLFHLFRLPSGNEGRLTFTQLAIIQTTSLSGAEVDALTIRWVCQVLAPNWF